MDYNLTLGKGKDAQQISSNDLKGGVKKEDIKDEKMRSIFEALDNGNGILEENEVNQLKAKVQEAASKDGDATNLSNKEAKSLIKSLGLKGFKAEDVFRFLGIVKEAGVNIDYQTRDAENPDEIVIKYKPDSEGNSVIERYRDNDGSLVGSIIQDKNNNTKIKNADNKILGGKNNFGNYVRINNEDGSYKNYYMNGSSQIYNQKGQLTAGQTMYGENYTAIQREDGSYTITFRSGQTQEYDKNDKLLSVKLANGTTWKNEYNEDGSYTKIYSNGKTQEYDKNNKLLSGKLDNGTTWEAIREDDEKIKYIEFTKKDGSKYYSGTDNKNYAHKTANGNFRISPKQGETFDDTMNRLGITDSTDQEIFKKANPKAYKRGYFLLGKESQQNNSGDFIHWDDGDVYIPKALADKLNIEDMLVDKTAEMEKHKQARKAPHMGI